MKAALYLLALSFAAPSLAQAKWVCVYQQPSTRFQPGKRFVGTGATDTIAADNLYNNCLGQLFKIYGKPEKASCWTYWLASRCEQR